VRPTGRASCSGCGRSWPARTSRYCGRCGAPLVAAPTSGRGTASFPWLPVTAVVVVLVALAATVVPPDLVTTRASHPDPVVELPAAAELPEEPGLTDDEARDALAPFDPARLRCEPAGCERWRFDAPHGGLTFAPFGELIAVHLDGHLVGLDPVTGERRWSVPLSAPGSAAPAPRGVREQVLLAADDAHVAVAREGGELRLVDATGRHRWVLTMPDGARIWRAHPVGDVVVTVGPTWRGEPARPGDLLHAFDVTDGQLRWTRTVDRVAGPLGDLVVLEGDEGLVRLDPASGEILHQLGDSGWAQRFGSVYLVDEDDAHPRVVDGRNAATVVTLELPLGAAHTHDGWLYLAAVPWDETGADGSPLQILAIDDEARLRWRRTLDVPSTPVRMPASRRAPDLTLTATDDLLLVDLPQVSPPWSLDLEDGTDRTFGDLTDGVDRHGEVAVTHLRDRLELRRVDGSRAWVPVKDAWLALADPPVVASSRGLLGVELQPDP
jgi:hypothetical protein